MFNSCMLHVGREITNYRESLPALKLAVCFAADMMGFLSTFWTLCVHQVIQHILNQQRILKDARKYTKQIKFKDDLPWAQVRNPVTLNF